MGVAEGTNQMGGGGGGGGTRRVILAGHSACAIHSFHLIYSIVGSTGSSSRNTAQTRILHDAVVESAAGDTARQLAELHGAGGPPGAGAGAVERVTALRDECLAASSAAEAAERASRLLGGPPLGPAGAGGEGG